MVSRIRISRKRRLSIINNKKARLALALAVVMLILVMGNKYRNKISVLIESKIGAVSLAKQRIAADSLIFSVGGSFRLDKPAETDTVLLDDAGKPYNRIIQPWPSELSTFYYVEKIRDQAGELGLGCGCVDSLDFIVCELIIDSSPGAVVVIRPDKKVKLKNRGLGFIFENFNGMENRDILKLVESNIPFGYTASIDIYPAGEIRKKLQSSEAWSILMIPSSKENLTASGIGRNGKNKDTVRESKTANDTELASELLSRNPNLRIIGFLREGRIDRSVTEEIIIEAKRRKLSYLYQSSSPDYIDSLAYSTGLPFISIDAIDDYDKTSLMAVKAKTMDILIKSILRENSIITIDISKIDIDGFIDFARALQKSGINFLTISELKGAREFIVEDL